jgi:hypothetical protein
MKPPRELVHKGGDVVRRDAMANESANTIAARFRRGLSMIV